MIGAVNLSLVNAILTIMLLIIQTQNVPDYNGWQDKHNKLLRHNMTTPRFVKI